jgi:hypothetical protein
VAFSQLKRFAVIETLGADRHGQEIATWIGKEKLRDALNLRARITGSAPWERDVRGRLAALHDCCAERRHRRAAHAGPDDIEAGGADRRGGPGRRDECKGRKPEPDGQAGGPHGLLLPQSREPAPPCPDHLHSGCPEIPCRHATANTSGDRTTDDNPTRLTSKSRISINRYLICSKTHTVVKAN